MVITNYIRSRDETRFLAIWKASDIPVYVKQVNISVSKGELLLDRLQLLNDYTDKFLIHRSMWEAEWNRTNTTDFSSRQALMLVILHNSGPQQAKELMGKLGVSSGGVTVMSDKLIKRGLIQRVKNKQDRRGIFLELTDQGREIYSIIERDRNVVMNKIFGVLTDVEVAILRELFTKLDGAKQ